MGRLRNVGTALKGPSVLKQGEEGVGEGVGVVVKTSYMT